MWPYYTEVIDGFLSAAECTSLLQLIESTGFDDQFSGDGRLIRSRAQFESMHWAQLIWRRLEPKLPQLSNVYSASFMPEPPIHDGLDQYAPAHLNDRFRCYKYGVNEEFKPHQDFAHEFSTTQRTFLTVLLYLNDDFTGGETAFAGYLIRPKLGMLALFPHELQHEGCKIMSGTKYSLRTDVVYEVRR